MSALLKVLGAISPPPAQPASRDFDGLEFRWKMFTFRPSLFKLEAILLGVVGAYLAWYFIGRWYNNQRADAS